MNELLVLAMNAHGVVDRWHEVRARDVRASLTGYLYALKEKPAGMVDRLFHVNTREPSVSTSPLGAPGDVGVRLRPFSSVATISGSSAHGWADSWASSAVVTQHSG